MSYNLFLDDFRMPKDVFNYTHLIVYNTVEWMIVRNYYAFTTIIENKGIPDIISFDHDLADEHYAKEIIKSQNESHLYTKYESHLYGYDEMYDLFDEKTGYHCALWLINYCIDNNKEIPNEILIHSMNPAGSMNIKSLFDSYNKIRKLGKTEVYILPSSRR